MKFEDRGNDIVIVTDNYEESVSKKLFHAENSNGELKIYGQKITPSNFIYSEITYPTSANITALVTTLNTWASGNDFHENSGGGGTWGSITGTLADQTDLQAVLDSKADANDASETDKGVVEEGTQIEINAGTDIGATGAKLFITPSKMAAYIQQAALTIDAIWHFVANKIRIFNAAKTFYVELTTPVATSNKTQTLQNANGTIALTSDIPAAYTDEQAQDAVGAMIDSSLEYTDVTPLLKVASSFKASIQGGFWGIGGSVIVAGYGAIVPYQISTFTAGNWDIEGDNASGSAVVDILRWNGAAYVSIIGAWNKPTISSARSATAAISGWTSNSIAAGDRFLWQLVSGSVFTKLNVTIRP